MGWFSSAVSFVTSTAKAVAKPLIQASVRKGGWRGLLSAGLKQFAFSFIASASISLIL